MCKRKSKNTAKETEKRARLEVAVTDSDSDSDEYVENEEQNVDCNETPDSEVDDYLIKSIKDATHEKLEFPPPLQIPEGINDICFSPNEHLLAVALSTGDVDMYNYSATDGNKLANKLELHTEACRDVEFNEDGGILFSASADRSIMMTDTNTSQLINFFDNAHDSPLYTLRVVGEHLFVSADDEGTVKMWDDRERKPKPIFSIKATDQHISDMITNSTGKYLICAGGDGVLHTINMNARKILTHSQGVSSEIVSLGLFRNETKLLVSSANGSMYIYNWGQFDNWNDEFPKIKVPLYNILPITENIFAFAGEDGVIRAANMFPHRQLGIIGKHSYGVHKIDINNEGEFIASYCSNNTIKFWNISFFNEMDINTAKYKKNKRENLRNNLPSSNMVNPSDFFSGLA